MKIKKAYQVSEKQLEANRKNALLGGVKTEAGKAISRFNALKHGLLTKEILCKGEDYDTLVELKEEIRNELNPDGTVEILFVELITAGFWRLRHAFGIEAETIKEAHPIGFDSNIKCITIGFENMPRYIASIENSILKSLHELERFQAKRKGEKVQAPVTVDVNVSRE